MSKLQVIVGSTRPGRSAERVFPWVVDRARRHGFEVEVLDLREWRLPWFAEHAGTIGEPADPTYSDPIVRAWNRKIGEADGYLIVTAEYNHGVPGELKNAVDSVWMSFAFRNKPVAFVGYSEGVSAGVRAVEHLALTMINLEAVPLRNTVLIPFVAGAFDDGGEPLSAITAAALSITLDDLAWWSELLARARADGELPPGGVRMRAAIAAAAPDAD